MKQGNNIYFILCAIPIVAMLIFLAIVNPLYFLLGLILVLVGLVLLKRQKPEWFRREKPDGKGRKTQPLPPTPPQSKTYMVLSEKEITMNKTVYRIGRDKNNDFVMDNPRIGRHHLRIEYNEAESVCYAVDMGSMNGTYLNSERMEKGRRYRLLQGARLTIDDHTFLVEYGHY